MLVKFQSSSNRVKNCSFHPTQPLILIALHNGSVQLYNYLLGTLINTFYAHNGPVRGVAFHPKQPLFVSGGDDYLIKLYNFKTNAQPTILMGHLDYIRSVYFHDELSWVISASDDQTLRIWNYMNRTCISILTGHNHYCMHAVFTPSSYGNYIISCSLDQTIRIWDYGILKNKHTTNNSSATLGDQFQMDCTVKFVLEGHDRGVNWVSVHPTQPLIASGADDRQVKVWRLGESRAWELSSFRGHYNNVSSVCFHPFLDLIISNSEDKSIRIWDTNKRVMVNTFKRDNDRFWCINPHSNQALFAAGHDSGVLVFKLERERPSICSYDTELFCIKNENIVKFDIQTNQETVLGAYKGKPRVMSYNPIEKSFLIVNAEESLVEWVQPSSQQVQQFSASLGVYIARNRIALLNVAKNKIIIKDTKGDINRQKELDVQIPVTNMISAGTAHVLLLSSQVVQLWDVQQGILISEVKQSQCKYAIWSHDLRHVALLSKHAITICTRNLVVKTIVHETLRIKSAVWTHGVLIYSTLNHLKYCLLNGDVGIIQTIAEPIYISKAEPSKLYGWTRQKNVKIFEIDPTEYLFKRALINRDYAQVSHIIENSNLMGQAIIAYLQKKGYPEVALQFVRDPATKFELAVECGDLNTAFETAKSINSSETWFKLGEESILNGNAKLAEQCYQQSKQLGKLSFLYLVNGNTERLQKMLQVHVNRQDPVMAFQTALMLGNVEKRFEILKDSKQYALAYMLAKTHGLQDKANEVQQAANITGPVLWKPAGLTLTTPAPLTAEDLFQWPLRSMDKGFFDGESSVVKNENSEEEVENDWVEEEEELKLPTKTLAEAMKNIDIKSDGWGVDDFDIPAAIVEDSKVKASKLDDRLVSIARTSSEPLHHISAGLFESAVKILYNQFGIVNFEILRPHFLRIYESNHASLEFLPNAPFLDICLSIFPYSLQALIAEITEAYKITSAGSFSEAVSVFREILQKCVFLKADPSNVNEVLMLIKVCRTYILGLSIEIERRTVEQSNPKRNVELSVYFASCDLQAAHLQLALRSSMSICFKAGCFLTCLYTAKRLLDMNPPDQIAQKVILINVDSDSSYSV
eukprot:NODE_155_length_15238_cov_1.162560.p1 type:complete len:1093 gc:universal NODE_155_length_15238_cov_1.162560:9323-12601(+)